MAQSTGNIENRSVKLKHHYAEEGLPLLEYQTKRVGEHEGWSAGKKKAAVEFFLAPYLTPKPSGSGVYSSPKELVIGQFLGGLKEGVAIQKISNKKLYLGEFLKDNKDGIGSVIEGTDLSKILSRILKPVTSSFDSEQIEKYGGEQKQQPSKSQLQHTFEIEGSLSNHSSNEIIYDAKNLMLGRVFNGQYKEGKKSGFGVVRDWKINLCKKGCYSNGKLDGFGVVRWSRGAAINSQYLKNERQYRKLRVDKIKSSMVARQQNVKSLQAKIEIKTLLNYSEMDYLMFEDEEFDYLYIGYFKEGTMNGFGIEVSKDQTTKLITEYRGFFHSGKRHGIGLQITYDPSCFLQAQAVPNLNLSGSQLFLKYQPSEKSEFFKLKLNGIENMSLCNYKDGIRHGEGCEYFANGDSYIGSYYRGLKHGFGCYSKLLLVETHRSPEKNSGGKDTSEIYSYLVYQGNFKEDQRHGSGRLEQKNRFVYDGEWKQNLRAGLGHQVQFNPKYPAEKLSEYFGDWADDQKHGFGCKSTASSIYKGQFLQNKPHGYGMMLNNRAEEPDRYSETAGVFKDGLLFDKISRDSEKYDRVLKVVSKVLEIPIHLKTIFSPKIDQIYHALSKSETDLMFLRKEFITVNQKCEELSLSFDNIFQILVKLLVGINKKLKNTHYQNLEYFVGYNPKEDATHEEGKKDAIQIEDFESSNIADGNVFDRHAQAFGKATASSNFPQKNSTKKLPEVSKIDLGQLNQKKFAKSGFNKIEEDIDNFGETERKAIANSSLGDQNQRDKFTIRDSTLDHPKQLSEKDQFKQELKELMMLKRKVEQRKQQLLMQGRTLDAVIQRPYEQLDLEEKMKMAQTGEYAANQHIDMITTERLRIENRKANAKEERSIHQQIALMKSQLERIQLEREKLLSQIPDTMRNPANPDFPILPSKTPRVDEMDEKELEEKLNSLRTQLRKLKAMRDKQNQEMLKNQKQIEECEEQLDDQKALEKKLAKKLAIIEENKLNFDNMHENYERGPEIRAVLENRLQQIQGDLAKSKEDLDKTKGENRTKTNKVKQLNGEIDFLQKQIDKLNSKEDVIFKVDPETGEKVRDLTYGVVIDMEDVNQMKTTIQNLKEEILMLEIQLRQRKESKNQQDQEMNKMNQEIEDITKATQQLEKNFGAEQEANRDLDQQIADMEKDMERQREMLKAAEKELADLDENLLQVLDNLMKLLQPQQEDAKELEKQIADLDKQKAELESKLKKLDKEREELRVKEDDYVEKMKAHEKRNEGMRQLESEAEKLEQRNSNLKDELREKQKKLEQLKQQVHSEETYINKDETDLQERKKALETEIQDVQSDLAGIEVIKTKLVERQAELEVSRTQLAEKKQILSDLEIENNRVEKDLIFILNTNEQKEKLIKQLQERSMSELSQKEIDKQNVELEKLSKRKKNLFSQKTEHQKMILGLKQREQDQAIEDKQKLSKQYELLEKRIEISKRNFSENMEILGNKKGDLSKELQKMDTQLSQLNNQELKISKQTESIQADIKLLQRQMEELEARKKTEGVDCELEFKQIETEQNEKKTLYERLNFQRLSQKGEGAANVTKCDQMKAEILKNVMQDVQKQSQQFEEKKERWSVEKNALESEIEELKRLISVGNFANEISSLGNSEKTAKKIGFESAEELERRTQKIDPFEKLLPVLDLSKMTTYAEESKNMEVSVTSSSIPLKNQILTSLQDPTGRRSTGIKRELSESDDEILAQVDSDGVYDSDEDSNDFAMGNNNHLNKSSLEAERKSGLSSLTQDHNIRADRGSSGMDGFDQTQRSRDSTARSNLSIIEHTAPPFALGQKIRERGLTIPEICLDDINEEADTEIKPSEEFQSRERTMATPLILNKNLLSAIEKVKGGGSEADLAKDSTNSNFLGSAEKIGAYTPSSTRSRTSQIDLKSPASIFLQAAVLNMSKEDSEDFKTAERHTHIEKTNFFKKHEAPRLTLDIDGCFTMEISKDFQSLYVGGPEGLHIINVQKEPLVISFFDNVQPQEIKCLNNSNLLIFNSKTTCLEHYDSKLNSQLFTDSTGKKVSLIMGLKTYFKSHTIETFPSISSRFTIDDSFFLWMKGQSELSVIDLQSMSNFTFNMWDYQEKNRKTKGLFCVASRNAGRIFGVTHDINDTFLLIFCRIKNLSTSQDQLTESDGEIIGDRHVKKYYAHGSNYKQDSKLQAACLISLVTH